jgi:hypothetical protein
VSDYWHRGSTVHRGMRNPIVLGRKFCAGCGHWRHVCDFRPRPRNTGSGLASRCRACERISNRQIYARRSSEVRARYNEYHRIWSEVQRRQTGIPPRSSGRRSVVDRAEYRFLPAGLLVAEVHRYLAHPPPGMGIADLGYGLEGLGRRAGVPARSITRLLRGESRHVRIDLADKLCVALGLTLALVYGDTPTESLRAS